MFVFLENRIPTVGEWRNKYGKGEEKELYYIRLDLKVSV